MAMLPASEIDRARNILDLVFGFLTPAPFIKFAKTKTQRANNNIESTVKTARSIAHARLPVRDRLEESTIAACTLRRQGAWFVSR